MRCSWTYMLCLMAGLCIATESHAQYDETPRAEVWIARVRTTGDSTFEMYVAFWSDTSLIGQRVLVKKRNEPDVLSVSTDTLNYRHIQHIKIARRVKKTDGIIAGALIGSITGAVAGGVYADYQNQQGTNNNNAGPCLGSFFDLMDASSVALGGMVGCGTGCLAGAGIGYYITTAKSNFWIMGDQGTFLKARDYWMRKTIRRIGH